MKSSLSNSANFLLAAWPIIIIVPLFWVPLPSVLTGHPWRGELALALYLIIAVISLLKIFRRCTEALFVLNSPGKIAAGLAFSFAVWGLISLLWSNNAASPIYHTALWASYLIFFGVACFLVKIPRTFEVSIWALIGVCAVYSAIAALEYFFRGNVDETFGFRYSRYAEISAVVLPLVLTKALDARGKGSAIAFSALALIWLQILASSSRTAAVVSTIGIVLFSVLRFASFRASIGWKYPLAIVALLIAVIAITQLPSVFSRSAEGTGLVSRLTVNEESGRGNSLTGNVRFLFYKVGLAMSGSNPLLGVGADCFAIRFNDFRAVVSEDPANSALASLNEDGIPERAHNEYLQVLAELGIVGASLFVAMLATIVIAGGYAAWKFRKAENGPLVQAAFAGIIVFLLSSMFSSFSFRLGQNGIVFFFLAAVCLAPFASERLNAPDRKFATIGLTAVAIATACLMLFASKGYSQILTYQAEHTADSREAEKMFRFAASVDPGNSAADAELGNLYFVLGEYNAARDSFERGIEKGLAPVSIYSFKMSSQALAGDSAGAIETARKTAHIFPYSVFARSRLADLLQRSGDQNGADAEFDAAARIDPEQAITWKTVLTRSPEEAAMEIHRGTGVSSVDKLMPQNGLRAIAAEFRRRRIDSRQIQIAPKE